MHFLEEFNYKAAFLWLLSFGMISAVLYIPGSPFTFSIFIPIIACTLFPNLRLSIVIIYTIISGMFFSRNFFSLHLYGNPSLDTWNLFSNTLLADNKNILSSLAFLCYLIVFGLFWFTIKKYFKRMNFYATLTLVFSILFVIFICWSSLKLNNNLSVVLNLTAVMLSHSAFYIFNYMRFYNHLPNDKKTFFALFQPFWYRTFEIPENPIIEDEEESERNTNLKKLAYLTTSILLFKLLLILIMSLFVLVRTGTFQLILDEMVIFNTAYLPIFKSWRTESVFTLLITLFFSSFTYLVSTFFVCGQTIVAIARMCGFKMPEYIDEPWKSSSFADFFTRVMYYYNIIIVNIFLYPTLDFIKSHFKNKKLAMFISLNWALVFGGLFARFLKDINAIYKYGYWGAHYRSFFTFLPYLTALALTVTISLYFNDKKAHKNSPIKIFKMLFYIFIYGLINPLNFSNVFGGLSEMGKFYIKLVSLGLY